METSIDKALDKIYSYVDYSMTHAKDVSKDAFTLDNIRKLLELRGNPQNHYPIIHVAGTKGKGSVCAMLAAALQNAGLNVGLYTSPHLIRFNERIQINGTMIPDETVIELTDSICTSAASVPRISSFELMTAMAFEYFKNQKVDIAIVETGLGGRLDATNVVTPILSIITSISCDHTSFLGGTIDKIAAEKAGIVKTNVPVICAPQSYTEAYNVIKATAARLKAPWISITDRFRFINQRSPEGNEEMLIWRVEDSKLMERWCSGEGSASWAPTAIELPLRGVHQMQNAATVYAALGKLRTRLGSHGFEKAIEGIGKTFWPCRFEQLAADGSLTVDGAHNIDSVEKLTELIDRYYGTKKVTCIFGASEDKDLEKMIAALAPHVDGFIMTRSIHPRAADPAVLSQIASGLGRKNRIAPTLEEAFEIYEKERNAGVCFIAAGSLFVAGGIRELFMKEDTPLPYFD